MSNQSFCVGCKYYDASCSRECYIIDGKPSKFELAVDPTNPQHYREFPVEVIQLVRHLNFNRGNAVKYLCRAGRKSLTPGQELEDLKKALWYVQDEIQRLTGEGDHAKP